MTQNIALACGRIALVDAQDIAAIDAFSWHANTKDGRIYAIRRAMPGKRLVLMHRVIAGADCGQVVDHINGNTLDNRRANLRIATNQQNSFNHKARGEVPFSGVTRCGSRFAAAIWPNGSQINLGTDHATAEQAAALYNAAATLLYGRFARLNPVPTDWAGLRALIARGLKGSEVLAAALAKEPLYES